MGKDNDEGIRTDDGQRVITIFHMSLDSGALKLFLTVRVVAYPD